MANNCFVNSVNNDLCHIPHKPKQTESQTFQQHNEMLLIKSGLNN